MNYESGIMNRVNLTVILEGVERPIESRNYYTAGLSHTNKFSLISVISK